MPVNHADLTMFSSIFLYPIAAAKASLSAHAGWFTVPFVAVSIVVGIATIKIGRKFIYAIMDFVLRGEPEKQSKWFQWVVGAPMLVLYFILPYAITAVGLCGTYFGTDWLARNLQ